MGQFLVPFCDKIDWQYIVKRDHAGQDQEKDQDEDLQKAPDQDQDQDLTYHFPNKRKL